MKQIDGQNPKILDEQGNELTGDTQEQERTIRQIRQILDSNQVLKQEFQKEFRKALKDQLVLLYLIELLEKISSHHSYIPTTTIYDDITPPVGSEPINGELAKTNIINPQDSNNSNSKKKRISMADQALKYREEKEKKERIRDKTTLALSFFVCSEIPALCKFSSLIFDELIMKNPTTNAELFNVVEYALFGAIASVIAAALIGKINSQ